MINTLYDLICEKSDIKKIDKLMTLTNKDTFNEDVRRFTKNVHSDHSIGRWECLSEIRYEQLINPNKTLEEIIYKK